MFARVLPAGSVLALLLAAGCGGSPPVASAPADAIGAAPTDAVDVSAAPVAPVVPPLAPPAPGLEPALVDAAIAPTGLPPAPVAPPAATTSADTQPADAKTAAPAAVLGAAVPPVAAAPAVPAPEAPAAPAAPTVADYTLDPSRSALYVQVFKEGETLAAGLSHDHVVAATGWTGAVRWDPADPSACKVDITVPVAGLRPDQEAMRKRVGYDVMLTDGQREDVAANMLAAGQLDATSFPEIRFASSSCEAAGDRVKVGGTLTVHGVSKPVSSTMKIGGDGQSFTASGTFSAKATDFGFSPYTALLGALKNKNEMKFTVDVRGAAR